MEVIVYLHGPSHMARPVLISVLAYRSGLPRKPIDIRPGAMTIVSSKYRGERRK